MDGLRAGYCNSIALACHWCGSRSWSIRDISLKHDHFNANAKIGKNLSQLPSWWLSMMLPEYLSFQLYQLDSEASLAEWYPSSSSVWCFCPWAVLRSTSLLMTIPASSTLIPLRNIVCPLSTNSWSHELWYPSAFISSRLVSSLGARSMEDFTDRVP